jgi:two-component system cell cycle response regulator CtrA
MKVLLIEKDSATRQSIELMLQTEGMNVYSTDLGDEGIDLALTYDYDAIITEIRLDDVADFDVVRSTRAKGCKTPIIVISGHSGTDIQAKAYNLGADDFVIKPFHKDILVSKIQAVVRRTRGHAQSIVQTGNLTLNLDSRTCQVAGRPVNLTGKEYQMLEILSLRKGTTITKEMFLNHLYGGLDEPEIKIIDVFICKLRKKLRTANAEGDFSGQHFIETVWGRGYLLKDPDPNAPQVKLETAAKPEPQIDAVAAQKELDAMMAQMKAIRTELGLSEGSSMEEALTALRAYKQKAEKLLEDAEMQPADVIEKDGSAAVSRTFKGASDSQGPVYVNGVRMPVGISFPIGGLIQVDTAECEMANIASGKTVKFDPAVGTILEIMTHFQGHELNKNALLKAIFEFPKTSNQAKLGQFMSQAQGALTQLVGRGLAASIIQVLSGGGYGMPRLDNLLTAAPAASRTLPAPDIITG